MKKALTIAGSDSGGGAGIQADIKTFQELGVYGMTAITAVTAQNTRGVQAVSPVDQTLVEAQIDSIASDIGADAVKTGMLFSSDIIKAVSKKIKLYKWEKVIVDPVMVAKGGHTLLQLEAVEALKKHLLPLSLLATPNIPEAEVLTGLSIHTLHDKKEAARRIIDLGVKNAVIKGGHEGNSTESIDLLFDGTSFEQFPGLRIATKNTHGTGCTFSASITAEIAKGKELKEAVQTAKQFIGAAIREALDIGSGHGPTNHWAHRKGANYVRFS
ncbi:bifunctional hydroxymethylpyrimidine kinase/phosphomethylpyrimidine kinase [Peribacillus sp. SCS-26]|uniref:bifunctional hydroxymethylpyrimidine kinase/phosphomethylpyrimidine kinase n=1 Tax=Paraperibacillus marinus TaxID=3115295 RepID=UPI0039062443